MIVEISLCIEKKSLPSDYRPTILSLFKAVLEKHYPEDYADMYENGNAQKDFTFAVKFSDPKFSGERMTFALPNVLLSISSADERLTLLFYNAFSRSRGYTHPLSENGTIRIMSVRITPHPEYRGGTAVVKLVSPLVVREHKRGSPDRYYTYDDPEFSDCFNHITGRQLGWDVNVSIQAVVPKKTVVRCFGTNIRSSLGTYRISAEPPVLDRLIKNGMGSRRDMGFGFCTVIGG